MRCIGAPRLRSATISASAPVLIAREREGQGGLRPRGESPRARRAHPASLLGERLPAQLEHRLQQEQLLEGELAPRGGEAGLVLGEVDLRERLGERHEPARLRHRGGNGVLHGRGRRVEGVPHRGPHPARGDPAGQGVHGHQPPDVEQGLHLALDHLEERVEHAPLERVQLAAHDHAHAALERAREEGLAEEVEPEARAAAVVERDLEVGAPGPRADGHGAVHGALDGQQLARPEVRDAHEAPRVEPGARIVAHQVLERGQAEAREGLGALGAHPRQELEPRDGLERQLPRDRASGRSRWHRHGREHFRTSRRRARRGPHGPGLRRPGVPPEGPGARFTVPGGPVSVPGSLGP